MENKDRKKEIKRQIREEWTKLVLSYKYDVYEDDILEPIKYEKENYDTLDIFFEGATDRFDFYKAALLYSFFKVEIPMDLLDDISQHYKNYNKESFMPFGFDLIAASKKMKYKLEYPEYEIKKDELEKMKYLIGFEEILSSMTPSIYACGEVSKTVTEIDTNINNNTLSGDLFVLANIIDLYCVNHKTLTQFYEQLSRENNGEDEFCNIVAKGNVDQNGWYAASHFFRGFMESQKGDVWKYEDPEEYLYTKNKQIPLSVYLAMIINAQKQDPKKLVNNAKRSLENDTYFSEDIFDLTSLLLYIENQPAVMDKEKLEEVSLHLIYMIQNPILSLHEETNEYVVGAIPTGEFKELYEDLIEEIYSKNEIEIQSKE